MRFSLGITLAAAFVLVAAASPAANAGLNTYYQEDFTGQNGDGIRGPVPPNSSSFSNGSWSVDGTGTTTLRNLSDFAFVTSESFKFRDLGGVSGGTPGSGVAVFTTNDTVLWVPGLANLSYLNMTLTASLSAVSAGSNLKIETLVNGTEVLALTKTLTTTGLSHESFDLKPYVNPKMFNTVAFRITATQDINATFSIDDILFQGLTTPEPASMSLLGMGVLAMCGAGYRRRKDTAVLEG